MCTHHVLEVMRVSAGGSANPTPRTEVQIAKISKHYKFALQNNRHKLTVCCIMLNSIFERGEMQGHDYDISDGHVGVGPWMHAHIDNSSTFDTHMHGDVSPCTWVSP
jgi:hypothetical protein